LSLDIEKNIGTLSLEFKTDISGERIGIFGASGSGKTTLINLISGLLLPDKGAIILDGNTLFSKHQKINISPKKRRIAIIFQQAMLFPHLSVKTNLFYGYKRCRENNRIIKPDIMIDLLKLQPLLQRRVKHLSGGEKQRIALGRAVLANPHLLLMDEPLSALDDTLRFQIITYLKSVSTEFRIPYLFISHSITEMQLMTDQVLIINKGQLIEVTTSEKLAKNRMVNNPNGYVNFLRLANPVDQNGLFSYSWGNNNLLVSDGKLNAESLFELSSHDIVLFKKHPEAISARNLLECTVTEMFNSGTKIGIVLAVNGEKLVAEIVRAAANELDIAPNSQLFAAIKASSFRRLN